MAKYRCCASSRQPLQRKTRPAGRTALPKAANRLYAAAAQRIDRLPESLQDKAKQALLEGRWQSFLGLGVGLTPSFDDACVGMAAVYTAMGRPLPLLEDLSVTTDVSARYLRLAQKGYFGQPLLALIHALWNHEADLPAAVRGLEAVGATSGSDMLYGVALALADRNRL